MGNRKCKNSSPWSPLLSPTRTRRPLAQSPLLPFSPSPLPPPRFALCPLLSALYNERGQGSVSDTPGSHVGSRPGSGLFR